MDKADVKARQKSALATPTDLTSNAIKDIAPGSRRCWRMCSCSI